VVNFIAATALLLQISLLIATNIEHTTQIDLDAKNKFFLAMLSKMFIHIC